MKILSTVLLTLGFLFISIVSHAAPPAPPLNQCPDPRCAGRQGPPGPRGLTGQRGPAGPQGPAGASFAYPEVTTMTVSCTPPVPTAIDHPYDPDEPDVMLDMTCPSWAWPYPDPLFTCSRHPDTDLALSGVSVWYHKASDGTITYPLRTPRYPLPRGILTPTTLHRTHLCVDSTVNP